MRATTSRWADGITSSHTLAVEVTLNGDLLPVTGGSVTLDITAATRGSCSLSFNDPDLIPIDHTSSLAPYTNEIIVNRGLVYPDGERELIQLGVFRTEEVEVASGPSTVDITTTGLDRSSRVIDAAIELSRTIAGGSDYVDTIKQLIEEIYPAVIYNSAFAEKTALTPTINLEEGTDRWTFVQGMASVIGMDLFFDNDGSLLLQPIPRADSEPVAYLVEGQSGVEVNPPSLLSASKRWSRTEAHSRWIVTGNDPENTGTTPRAVVTDEDEHSPTYYYGAFGAKPDFFSSTLIVNNEMANTAAEGRKAKEMGTIQTVDFGALVNPALEPGDVVRITRTQRDPLRPDNPFPIVDEDHIIDSLNIPLGASETMTGTTRAIRVTE